MKTLHPYPNFVASALVLDRARLGKQRVECAQIISALVGRSATGEPPDERRDAIVSLPSVAAWAGHLPALCLYASIVAREWERRGYVSSLPIAYQIPDDDFPMTGYFLDGSHEMARFLPAHASDETIEIPRWVGEESTHSAHRRELLEKNPEWYGRFGWEEGS